MFDKHADEAIEAEIWLKAEAKGHADGLAEGEANERAKNAARDKKIAEYLRSIGVSEDDVAKAISIM